MGATAIADALRVNAVLTAMNLLQNKIGDAGASAIAEALRVNAVLTELRLSFNQIGDSGATAIADQVLFVEAPSLTVVCVWKLWKGGGVGCKAAANIPECSHAEKKAPNYCSA